MPSLLTLKNNDSLHLQRCWPMLLSILLVVNSSL